MKKDVLAIIGAGVGLVLILLALFTPWYSLHMKAIAAGIDTDINEDIYLNRIEMRGVSAGQDMKEIYYYEDIREFVEKINQSSAMPGTLDESSFNMFAYTMYITIGTLITLILALILGIIQHFRNANKMRKMATVFGVLTFALTLLAIIYFMINLTTIVESQVPGGDSGFWFEKIVSGAKLSGGPVIAWYSILGAGIISLISSVVISKTSRVIQIVPTEEKQREKITKTIKCPSCGETQEVHGVLGERVEVTCKKCNGKGVFHFR